MRLLVIEDEIKTGDYLQQGLTEAGFLVTLVQDVMLLAVRRQFCPGFSTGFTASILPGNAKAKVLVWGWLSSSP